MAEQHNLSNDSTLSYLFKKSGKDAMEKVNIVNERVDAVNARVDSLQIQSANNYCKLPDGTMIAHGAATFSKTSTGVQTVRVNFPVTFVSFKPNVICSWCDTASVYSHMGVLSCSKEEYSYAEFVANRTNAGYDWYFRWIAIGRWK